MENKSSLPGWSVIALSFLLLFIFAFFLYRMQANARFLSHTSSLPVNLHSTRQADYSTSLRPNSVAAIGLGIIADALRDNQDNSANTPLRLTELASSFFTPVAFVTGTGNTPTAQASNTAGPSPTGPTPTITQTATFGPSPTPTNSATPGPSPTATKSPTLGPSATPTKSSTPGPSPTATKTATPGPSSTPTRTSTVGPSSTATQTKTLTPTASGTPTNTTIPPSATNTNVPATSTTAVCTMVLLPGITVLSNRVNWSILNSSPADIEITQVSLQWPGSNGNLRFLRLDGSNIWQGNTSPPSTTINSGWLSGSRLISTGDTGVLQGQFDNLAFLLGYSIEITFSNGCQVQSSL